MKYFFLISFWIGMAETLWGDPLVVAAGKNFVVDSLDAEEIRALYVAKKFRIGNQKIIPVNLGIEHPLRIQFEQDVLSEERSTLAHLWLQAHYLGHRTPKVFKSQETVAEFLSKIDNSVGYIDESMAQRYHLKILFRGRE